MRSDRYGPDWRGSLRRPEVRDDKELREERLLEDLGDRIPDVRQGPDGWLYLLTDSPQGRLLRLQPLTLPAAR